MNFSFSKTKFIGNRKQAEPVAATPTNPFGADEESGDEETTSSKPLDYVKAMIESEQRRAALAAAEARHEAAASFRDDDEGGDDNKSTLPDRTGVPLGPLGEALKGNNNTTTSHTRGQDSVPSSRPGLVVMGQVGSNRESKHIQRMVETSQVNEKFKNLLKIKIADKEKAKAEEEFGSRPEEIVTSAYVKQRQESLALEKELEAKESNMKKKDMTNMFREMLESGSYARTNYHEPSVRSETSVGQSDLNKSRGKMESVQVSEELVKKVLDKVVSEETKEVAKAIEARTRMDVMKIVQQVEEIVGNDDQLEEDAETRRMSAKERYLARKRQKMNEQ